MNESEKPLEGVPQPGDEEQESGPEATEREATEKADTIGQVEEVTAELSENIEAGTSAAAQAADDAAQAMESYAGGAEEAPTGGSEVSQEASPDDLTPGAAVATQQETYTLTDRLIAEREYDDEATQDDKLLAAISYASQLFFPISILVPVVLLISETTKTRTFQRYHAVQSLALGLVLWVLQGALGLLATIAGATIIGILCLCFIVPAMILFWLLPLYYAIQAFSGQRFRIPGLTQFLQDQGWL